MKPIAIKPAYLDREAVASFVSLSVNSLERLIASGVFPKPRQVTAQRVDWLSAMDAGQILA